MPSLHELPFLAPIPRGHELFVVTFSMEDRSVVQGVCAGTLISTKRWGGDRFDAKTLLLIEPAGVV